MKLEKIKRESCLAEQYDEIWKSYLNKNGYEKEIDKHRKNRTKYYDIICKFINNEKNKRIIELGCGTCIDINLIAKRRNSLTYFASDISKYSIFLAQKINRHFKNSIHVHIGDIRNLPFKGESFDLVFSQGLVEHFHNSKAIIKEQKRILKPNGILIVNVPQKFTGYTLMKHRKMRNDNWELGWETEFSYYNLKKIGDQLGLKELDVSGYQYWKSWQEPTFVLKDLMDKVFRKIPLKRVKVFENIRRGYNSTWQKFENKWGHYFLQNIIIVFQK